MSHCGAPDNEDRDSRKKEKMGGVYPPRLRASENLAYRSKWYDLSGRPLNGEPTQAGVYVKNGKKVVIK